VRYIDVCSGISAPTMAWKPLGWQALCFAEIEAAPRAVLAHHYPDVPLNGDFTQIKGDEYGPVDLLVGGTPCQSFSVAGLRGGLGDDRGNLALEYLRLADRTRSRWLVWENVPGVLSSNGGRDFGAILGGMVELGYGIAYRVLDAQHFGVPQRRRRVFVVGYLGDWRRPAAVLFERHSLSGDTPPRREARQVAPTIPSRSTGGGGLGTDFDCDGGLVQWPAEVAPTLNAAFGSKQGLEDQHIRGGVDYSSPPITAMCLNAGAMGRQDAESEALLAVNRCGIDVAHSLRGEGFDASEDGTGRGTPLVVAAIQERAICENPNAGPDGAGFRTDGQAYTLEARTVPQAICFSAKDHGGDAMHDLSPTPRAGGHSGSHANAGVMPAVAQSASAVRRLTPRECERLQGFPDDFTLAPHRGKPMADGPRYKMLGNSMAVPVVRWIGERISAIELAQMGSIAA
jgi:DNA (cytosine-5)-methyltransferase 1